MQRKAMLLTRSRVSRSNSILQKAPVMKFNRLLLCLVPLGLLVSSCSSGSGNNTVPCDISKSDLKGANLAGCNLTSVDLSGRDLSKANLSGAKLVGATLVGTDLNNADVSNVDFRGANLTDANLYFAINKGANFAGATLPDGMPCSVDPYFCPYPIPYPVNK